MSNDKQIVIQFVGFYLEGQQYAFRIDQIQEIVILDNVTRVPNVPPYVEGVSNLRGSIIPIINLREMMGMNSRPGDAETRTVVVNVGERTIGCTVDSVSQVVRIPEDDIQDPPESVLAGGADYITGFATVDEQLVVVLDADLLLNSERLQSV